MGARFKKMIAATSGSEIAEAALVLPLAFMVLLGIYWFGRAFNVYATINHAAREGARYAVVNTCATCSSANTPPTLAKIATQVGQAMQASGLDPGLAKVPTNWVAPIACLTGPPNNCSSSTGAPQIEFCSNAQLTATPPQNSGGPACGVTIDLQYPFQLPLPFTSVNGQQVDLTAHVQMRAEQ